MRVDHYVRVHSTVPAIAGQTTRASLGDRVVLFIHGSGTPAEVAFDVPYQDYSWMAYLANAGFDVFPMDTTGYGRSTRPAPMTDPCNLSPEPTWWRGRWAGRVSGGYTAQRPQKVRRLVILAPAYRNNVSWI